MDTYLELNERDFVLGIPITKIDIEKRIVEGFATLDNVDKVKDRLSFDASKQAFKKWAGNIREMHQKEAVGRKMSYTEKQYTDPMTGKIYNGIWLAAKISKGAENTWQKVLDGTLGGFSVGGAIKEVERTLEKDGDEEVPVRNITKYDLGEVSLVDNPCNPLATVSLIKSYDDNIEVADVLDEEEEMEFEKAAQAATVNNTRPPMKGTKPMQDQQAAQAAVPMDQPEDDDIVFIKKILQALQAWRDDEAQEGDDHDVAFVSSIIQQIKERVHAGDPGPYGNDQAVMGESRKPAADKTAKSTDVEDLVKTDEPQEEVLHNNEISDIPNIEELTKDDRGIVCKFIDFLAGKNQQDATEQVAKEENIEMDIEQVKEAVSEVTSELSKAVDGKFDQVGESLTKVAEALSKLATVEALDELKKSFDESLTTLNDRVAKVEDSGAVKKSADDEIREEILEKSDTKGFWSSMIVPGFIQNQYREGR